MNTWAYVSHIFYPCAFFSRYFFFFISPQIEQRYIFQSVLCLYFMVVFITCVIYSLSGRFSCSSSVTFLCGSALALVGITLVCITLTLIWFIFTVISVDVTPSIYLWISSLSTAIVASYYYCHICSSWCVTFLLLLFNHQRKYYHL